MQSFFHTYDVFNALWKCLFTFGRREGEAEFSFPTHVTRPLVDDTLAFRRIGKLYSEAFRWTREVDKLEGIESAYVLRRAELHGRDLIEGQSPWSIRQTAVYHQYRWDANPIGNSRSVFLLIAPSAWVEKQLLRCLDIGNEHLHAVSPSSVQSILVADSLRGWMRYMSWLEGELNEKVRLMLSAPGGVLILTSVMKSTRMVFTRPGSRNPTNLEISVEDSQVLKTLDDSVTDLQVILSTLLSTVRSIQQECQLCCQMECYNRGSTGDCDRLSEQFDQYIKELETFDQRAAILRDKATSAAKLVCCGHASHLIFIDTITAF
jgi:hypothetical protein